MRRRKLIFGEKKDIFFLWDKLFIYPFGDMTKKKQKEMRVKLLGENFLLNVYLEE